jgi:hypothetical protein
MISLNDSIIKLLADNGINYKDNGMRLATGIKDLVNEFTSGDTAKLMQLESAKLFTSKNLKKGTDCPLCKQDVKMYWKKIDSNMAKYLIVLYKLTAQKTNREYFHTETDLKVTQKVGGSFAKLRWWGLIEQKEKDTDYTTARTSGLWKITDKGKQYVRGEIKLPLYVKLYNKKMYGTDGKDVDIRHSLNAKFNYTELMNSPL